MKWFLIPYLLLAFLFGFANQDISHQSHVLPTDSHSSSGEIHSIDLFSLINVVSDFEIETEEEDDDDNQDNYLLSESTYQSSNLTIASRLETPFSKSFHVKPVKLFVLFHSWKSHIFI